MKLSEDLQQKLKDVNVGEAKMTDRIEKIGSIENPQHFSPWEQAPPLEIAKAAPLERAGHYEDTLSSAKETLTTPPLTENALDQWILSLMKAERANDEEGATNRMIGVQKQLKIKKSHTQEYQQKLEEMAKSGEIAKYLGWAQIALTGAAAISFVTSFFVTLGIAPAILAVSTAAVTAGKTYQNRKAGLAKGESVVEKAAIYTDQKRIADALEDAKQERERVASLTRMQKELLVNGNEAIRKIFR